MKKRRAYRAPSADSQTWTKEDRLATQQSRVNARSSRFHRENAAEKAFATASPRSSTK